MVLVGIVVTTDPSLTLPKATGLSLGLTLWRYFVIAVHDRLQIIWAVFGYILLGFAFTLTGILNADWLLKAASQVSYMQHLLDANLLLPSATPNPRLSVHPNQISGTITLYLPLLISVLTSSTGFRDHKFALILLLVIAILTSAALLLIQSKSAWIGVASGLISIVILQGFLMFPSSKRKILLIYIGIMFLFSVIIVGQVEPGHIQELWFDPPQLTMFGSLDTLIFRQKLWPWALTALADFPFTGVGLGNFRQVVRLLYPLNISPDFDIAHAHNMFLQTALDIGIPGLISYISFLIISGIIAWRIATRDKQMQSISIGLVASLVAFHIFGLFDALALGSKPGLLLWGIFGLLTISNRFGTHHPKLNDRQQ